METMRSLETAVNTEFSLPFFGKHFVIVGGTSGIGLETAKQLSKQGASVMVIGNKEKSGKNAVEAIKHFSDNPNTTYASTDLSSINATLELTEWLQNKPKIHGFLYYAAPKQDEEKITADGISKDFAVGLIAPNILIKGLLGTDKKDSRFNDNALVGYLSSTSFLLGKVDLDKITGEEKAVYNSREEAYAGAKRAMVEVMQQKRKEAQQGDPTYVLFDPFVTNTERVRTQAKEIPIRLINLAIKYFGFSAESTANHLIKLAQKHFSGEPLPFYNLRGFALPDDLLPHADEAEVKALLQLVDELIIKKT